MLVLTPKSRANESFELLLFEEIQKLIKELGLDELVSLHYISEKNRILLRSRSRHMGQLSGSLGSTTRKTPRE